MALLKRAFSLGVEGQKVTNPPIFPKLEERNVRKGFVEVDQFRRLAGTASELWFRSLLEVGHSYGWRVGELLNLQVKQVEFANRTIRLEPGTTKNDEAREVIMTSTVHTLLAALCHGKSADQHVFTRSNGQPVRDFRCTWQNACVAAGLGRFTCRHCGEIPMTSRECAQCKAVGKPRDLKYTGLIFHDLRRTAVRNLVNAGVPEKVAIKISGHKTRSVFDRYHIISRNDVAAAMVKLEASQVAHGYNPVTIAQTAAPTTAPAAAGKVN